jgi:transcriptional regulator NrdR family protein
MKHLFIIPMLLFLNVGGVFAQDSIRIHAGVTDVEKGARLNHDTVNLAPNQVLLYKPTIKINDKEVKNVQIKEIVEYLKGINHYAYMQFAYVTQTPRNKKYFIN